MLTIAAVDIGYRNTKLVYQAGTQGRVRSLHFPSIAVKASTQMATEVMSQRDTRLVRVDDESLEVGPDARLLLGPRSNQILHEAFVGTLEYRALFYGALSYIGLPRIDVLVGGLPVRHMESGQAALEAFMQGTHEVPGLGEVTVRNAKVIPQPLGGLMHHNTMSTARNDRETVLLVDPGYFTLDWTAAEGFRHLPALTGSFPAGISSGLLVVADLLSRELGTPVNDLDAIDRQLRRPTFRYGGVEFSRPDIEEALQAALKPGIVEMRNRVGAALGIDRIVLCGGGALFYEPLVREAWPRHEVTVMEDPLMANVRGFHVLARNLAQRHREVAA